jgi:hypothetical protein
MLVPDGATIPYPPLTKDLHHEVELIVAMKSGGPQHSRRQGARPRLRLCVGIDLTRRDLQIASRKKERPWEVRQVVRLFRALLALQPAAKIGHPSKAGSGSRSTAPKPEGRSHRTDLERAGNHLAALAAGRSSPPATSS